MNIRRPHEHELDTIARIWHEGWHEAHKDILPEVLVQLRTLEHLRERLAQHIESTRVAVIDDAPVGMCMIEDDALDQFYVDVSARGSGVAAGLVADAEQRLVEAGISRAWLACAIGNHRAARFYEKCGWQNTGEQTIQLETPAGPFELAIWRFEKQLGD